MDHTTGPFVFDARRARAARQWCADTRASHPDPFDAARAISRRLGTQVEHTGDGEVCVFGFWAPEVVEFGVHPGDVRLEILVPIDELSLQVRHQYVRFDRHLFPVELDEGFVWSAVRGLPAGRRDRIGAFYQLRYRDRRGRWQRVPDYLACSVPFGAFAPAELYDVASMQANRRDGAYWQRLAATDGTVPRQAAPLNILEVHVGTATAGGSLASLERRYAEIAQRIKRSIPLRPEDEPFVEYDAIQLMPIEPTTVFEAGPDFWSEPDPDGDDLAQTSTVELTRPCTTNWGYDVVLSAMSAVNPALLEAGRPDELVDLIATLHNFPTGPIRVVFDVVFGHADNQALPLLNRHFFLGPNMYGQDVNYRHPVVRALLLEMQRRKVDFGADGVRVDGAQDFKWWDAESQVLRHDDEYLAEMAEIEQQVAGVAYMPWFVFEDGRPWPRPDWEISSTYKHVIEAMPHTYQWGPLTFAHNTPFVFTFWLNKWWRVREILEDGEQWISGCANHDTVRRGTQIDPRRAINRNLGDTLLEILDNAYDNPAATMLAYTMFPGVPMDFLNASCRAPWGFVRNTDDVYGVKIAAEESPFIDWQVDEISYARPGSFRRLKEDWGFDDLDDLRRFMLVLRAGVEGTDYDLDAIADILSVATLGLPDPSPLDVERLKTLCRDYMDDVYDYCNVTAHVDALDPTRTRFNRTLRRFRRERPWLRSNLRPDDSFGRRQPCRGTALYYGLRHGPHGEALFFVGNMEGGDVELVPSTLPIDGLRGASWRPVLATPRLSVGPADTPVVLRDSEAVVFRRTDDQTKPEPAP